MSVETLSERLFKQHCASRGVPCRRIEEDGSKVADFELTLTCGSVFAEVKQLDPNDRDRARELVPAGQVQGSAVSPSSRVRNLISDAYRQIKPYAKQGLAAITVCYNNAGGLNFIDNFSVTRAMFGGMAVSLALDQAGAFHVSGQGFTGGRKVSRNTCRGLSAVCVLSTPSPRQTRLVAYHNPYANVPISPGALSALADKQFGYDDPHGGWNVDLLAHELDVQPCVQANR